MSEEKLAYLVTMESGRVFLAVVHGRSPDHGEKQAIRLVQTICDEECWDACGYPGGDKLPLGVTPVAMPTTRPTPVPARPPIVGRPLPPQRLGR